MLTGCCANRKQTLEVGTKHSPPSNLYAISPFSKLFHQYYLLGSRYYYPHLINMENKVQNHCLYQHKADNSSYVCKSTKGFQGFLLMYNWGKYFIFLMKN